MGVVRQCRHCCARDCWGGVPFLGLCQGSQSSYPDGIFAFIAHGFARGPTSFAAAAFYNPYLTLLAKFEAASTNSTSVKWMGINILASSYVALYITVLAVVIAVVSPVLGVLSDGTPHRRRYLIISTYLACVFFILCGFVTQSTWWLGGILAALALGIGEASLVFVYAYLPELGDTDAHRSSISARTLVATNGGQIVLTAFIIFIMILVSPAAISLDGGTFQSADDISEWNYAYFSDGSTCSIFSESCAFSNNSCSDMSGSFCYRGEEEDHSSNEVLVFTAESGSNPGAIYQVLTQPSSELEDRTVLVEAELVDISGAGVVSLMVWSDAEESIIDTSSTSTSLLGLYKIPETTEEFSFAVGVEGAWEAIQLDDLSMTESATIFPAVTMSLAGIWFVFFGSMAVANFPSREQSFNLASTNCGSILVQTLSIVAGNLKQVSETRSLLFFFLGYSLYSAGATAVATIAGVYFAEVLGYSSGVIAGLLFFAQLCGILGAYLFHMFAAFMNSSHASLALSYFTFGVSLLYAYFLLNDETTSIYVSIFGVILIGMALGGSISQSRTAFSDLIPVGREGEYMGIYNFASKWISWLGTLLYAIINEATGDTSLAFLSISGLFFTAAILEIASRTCSGKLEPVRPIEDMIELN